VVPGGTGWVVAETKPAAKNYADRQDADFFRDGLKFSVPLPNTGGMLVAEARTGTTPDRHRLASDLDLCGSCNAGSRAAFSELIERHRAPLLAYCGRLVGADHAEDVLQQCLLKAWVSLEGRGVDVSNPRAWLYRIAHNQAMDHLRQAGAPWDELDCEWESPESTERTVEALERLGRVSAGIRELPQRQREALLMHSVDGASYADVATTMQTNVPTVSQLIVRARARLREIPVLLPPWFLARRLIHGSRRVVAGLGGGTKVAVVAATLATGAGVPLVATEAGQDSRAQAPASPAAAAAAGALTARHAHTASARPHRDAAASKSSSTSAGATKDGSRFSYEWTRADAGANPPTAPGTHDSATATSQPAAGPSAGQGGRSAPHVSAGNGSTSVSTGVPGVAPVALPTGPGRVSSTSSPVHVPTPSVPAGGPALPPLP
jgi:RNA polymerase sigma factor (sigma-70 family)